MPDPTPDSPPSQATPILADRAIVSGGDKAGKINTGLIKKSTATTSKWGVTRRC